MTRRAFTRLLAAAPAAAQTPPPMRLIDPHVHIWTHDPSYPFARETSNPPQEDALPETLLQLMAANGVSHTVLIQVIHYRWDNSFVRDTARKYQGKFLGVCRVNPESARAPDDLARLVEEDGFRGVRISPNANAAGDWIGGPLMPPLWRRTQELRVPMTVLTSTSRLPQVARLIELCPDLDVVIDHMADCPPGQPAELQKLLDLARFPRVYVKISHTWAVSKEAYPWQDAHAQVKKLYDAFGPQRLMWGTDWPVVLSKGTYARALMVVRDEMTFLNDEDRRWILGRTVERIWPFPEKA